MAKKLPWGSFSHEDLRVDREDDIYQNFPFLNFIGMSMVKINELRIGDNAVRSIQDTLSQKIVGLTGSLFNGWDRTSWPIPFVRIQTEDTQDKEAFDRRHTIKVCRGFKHVDEAPGAEYERCYPENGGVFNKFDMNSILTMAAMWGNVYGPIVEDTKEHNYETACVNILSVEQEKTDENLLTKDFVRTLLKYMGCYSRYNENLTVINRIAGRVLDALKDPENVSGKLAINNDKSSLDDFIKKNPPVVINLKPGQFSLHHVNAVHGSGTNLSNKNRIGFAVRYITAETKHKTENQDSAIHVCGQKNTYFKDELRPISNFSKESIISYNDAMQAAGSFGNKKY